MRFDVVYGHKNIIWATDNIQFMVIATSVFVLFGNIGMFIIDDGSKFVYMFEKGTARRVWDRYGACDQSPRAYGDSMGIFEYMCRFKHRVNYKIADV